MKKIRYIDILYMMNMAVCVMGLSYSRHDGSTSPTLTILNKINTILYY